MIKENVYTDNKTGKRPSRLWLKIKRQKTLILMSIPFILYMLLFSYAPMVGLVMAFQDFAVESTSSMFGSPWIGWGNFKELFALNEFWLAFRNTVIMGVLNLVAGTVSGVFLALILNEVRLRWFKKFTQTISYLPYFLSWVIVANLVSNILSLEGIVNEVLTGLHLTKEPILFMGKPELFWVIITLSSVWKGVGYGSIVYLAAITSIDPNLYEAASIDGAGRLRKIWNVTLPCIMPTIQLLFIMNVGWVIGSGFEQQMLLRNSATYNVSIVIDLFVLKYGTQLGRFSFATAAGLFKSVINVLLLGLVNFIGKKLNGTSLY